MSTIKNLCPNTLFLKEGIIHKLLKNKGHCDFAFQCFIELPIIQNCDINDTLIGNLIAANGGRNSGAKNKALDRLSRLLSSEQLDTYVEHSLNWGRYPDATPWTAIPIHFFDHRLELLFTKYAALLKDKNSYLCRSVPISNNLQSTSGIAGACFGISNAGNAIRGRLFGLHNPHPIPVFGWWVLF